jgi:hypothetical protein
VAKDKRFPSESIDRSGAVILPFVAPLGAKAKKGPPCARMPCAANTRSKRS